MKSKIASICQRIQNRMVKPGTVSFSESFQRAAARQRIENRMATPGPVLFSISAKPTHGRYDCCRDGTENRAEVLAVDAPFAMAFSSRIRADD
eukprot:COSAG05_NODE_2019_length_3686_cov_1.730694_1_plen_93_part_00